LIERGIRILGKGGFCPLNTILLVNDDGIGSLGLAVLARKLRSLGDVVIVTPRHEVSGIGKAITCSRSVMVDMVELGDDLRGYAVDGTPADAVLLALNKLLGHKPDLVVTGINLGPNLGIDDFLDSGTIGAALEAAIHGVPALAVSYCAREISYEKEGKAGITGGKLGLAADMAEKVARHILERGMPEGVDLLLLNVPEGADPTRLMVTNLSYAGYGDLFTTVSEGGCYRIMEWRLSEYADVDPESDVHAVKQGCISITPVEVRLRHNRGALKALVDDLSDSSLKG
jgi:5'-nucleotidase